MSIRHRPKARTFVRAADPRDQLRASDVLLAMLLALVVILGVVAAIQSFAPSAPQIPVRATLMQNQSQR